MSDKEYLRQLKKEMLWMCRTYQYHKMMYGKILDESAPQDGQPSSHYPKDIVGNQAIKLAAHGDVIYAVEHAINDIPEEYRSAVWAHCVLGRKGFPQYADRKTYYTWQSRFLLAAAKYRHLI